MTETDLESVLNQLSSLGTTEQISLIYSLNAKHRSSLFELIPNFLSDDEPVYYSIVEDEGAVSDDLLLSKLRSSNNRRIAKLIRQTLVRRSASALNAGAVERCVHLLLEAGKIRPLNEGLSQRLARAVRDGSGSNTAKLAIIAGDYLAVAQAQLAEEFLSKDDRAGIERTIGILGELTRTAISPPARSRSQKPQPGPNETENSWNALRVLEDRALEHARALYKNQSFLDCEAYCSRLIGAGFPYAEVYKLLVLSLGKRHLFSEALDIARRALVEVDDRPSNIRQKIACATASGDYGLAVAFIGECFDRGIDHGEFWAAIASFAWQRGDLELAGAAATASHAKAPNPEMKRLAARSNAASELLTRHRLSMSLEAGSVIDRLGNPPEPFVAEAIRRLLGAARGGGAPRSTAAPAAGDPNHVAIVGMHLGFGGSPQKALRLASYLAGLSDGPKITYLCPEARSDRDLSEIGRPDLDVVIYGTAEPAQVDPDTDALLKLCGNRRRAHVLALLQTLQRLRVDTVHAIGTMELLLEVAIACSLAGTRLCVLNPGMMRPGEYARKDVSRDETKNYRALLRAVSDHPRFVIANNSQRAAADIADWLDIPTPLVSVLRNGTILPDAPAGREDRRKALGLNAEDFVISVVGRLAHEKFPELCLDVFASLKVATGRPIKLLFVGDGPMRAALEESAQARGFSESVGFTGFVETPGRYYEITDTVLFLTRAEGLPNVVIEAQAHGVPVVASDGGGTAECLRSGETGFLLPTLDASAITSRLRELAESTELAASMGRRARLFAAQYYSMPRMASDALAIYSGGRTSALSLWRKDARRFRTEPYSRRDVEKWAKVARAQTAAGGIGEARRLMAMALRVTPGSKACWDELVRAEAMLARLPRARTLYAGLVQGWHAAGRISSGIAGARMMDLGFATGPGDSGPLTPARIADAVRRDQWSVLQRAHATSDGSPSERLRHAVRVQDTFADAGLALQDGEDPIVRLLGQDWPSAEGGPGSGVTIWIGSLALGGGERQIANLLWELSRLGVEVQLLVDRPDETSNTISSIVEPRAISELEEALTDRLDSRLATLLFAISSEGASTARADLAKLVVFLARQRPAIVHVRGVAENALVVAAAAALAGTPRIIINIGTMLHSRQSDGRADTLAQHERNIAVLNAIAANPASVFVFNSAGAQADWQSRVTIPHDRCHVISNGFDASAFGSALPERLAHVPAQLDRLRASGTSIVFGVFRFHHVKRPLLWVKAALELLDRGKRCHFVIAGDGRLMAEAGHLVKERQAQAHFTFLGAVEVGLGELYGRADVLMHTARTESSPNVVLEAEAFGVAVVAPRVGGVSAIVREGETAILVSRQTARAYAHAVSTALEPRMQKSAKEAGPALVRAIAAPERVSAEFLRLYGTNEISK